MQNLCELRCFVPITMQADRIGMHGQFLSIQSIDLTPEDNGSRLLDSNATFVDDGASHGSRCEAAICQIAPIGERFMNNAQSGISTCLGQLATGQTNQGQLRIKFANRMGNSPCQFRLARCLVVQGAMRLDVNQTHAFFRGDIGQSLQLLADQCVDVDRVPWLLMSTEMLAISESRMRTGCNVELPAQAQGAAHA